MHKFPHSKGVIRSGRIVIAAAFVIASIVVALFIHVVNIYADSSFVGAQQAQALLTAYTDLTDSGELPVAPATLTPLDQACCDRGNSDAINDKEVPYKSARIKIKQTKSSSGSPAKKVAIPSDTQLVDSIKAIVVTDQGNEIILKSDLDRPTLTGGKKSLDTMIFDRLVYSDAKRFKQLPDDNAIDKYISRVMRENNLNRQQLEQMFGQAGYSYQEGREELRRLQAINAMISQKVYAQVMVSRKEVLDYFNAHPEIIEASRQVSRAVVPYKDKNAYQRESEEQALKLQLKNTEFVDSLSWSEPFWINSNQVAADKRFIFDLGVGQISSPCVIQNGFELLKITGKEDERPRPIEERYAQIAEILARPRYDILLEKYRTQLMESASIVYTH